MFEVVGCPDLGLCCVGSVTVFCGFSGEGGLFAPFAVTGLFFTGVLFPEFSFAGLTPLFVCFVVEALWLGASAAGVVVRLAWENLPVDLAGFLVSCLLIDDFVGLNSRLVTSDLEADVSSCGIETDLYWLAVGVVYLSIYLVYAVD